MPSVYSFYGFTVLENAQAISAFIHLWSAGIIESLRRWADMAAWEAGTDAPPHPTSGRTRQTKPNRWSLFSPKVLSSKCKSIPAQMTFRLHPSLLLSCAKCLFLVSM